MYTHKCTKCGVIFDTNQKKRYLCKPCMAEYAREHRKNNRESINEYARIHNKELREIQKEQERWSKPSASMDRIRAEAKRASETGLTYGEYQLRIKDGTI